MANVRQYIGARYVMKVYENSLDPSSAEWESGITYEPLTMVTYNNSSYLSKKDVSSNIGNPADNPTYWVVTGSYNGQIAALQDEIDDINLRLFDAKVIFMPLSKSVPPHTYAAGDCTVFITEKNRVIMIDSGTTHSYTLIRNKLQELGITHIDYFILSHFHYDHTNNIDDLIADGYIDATTVSYLPRTGATASDIEDEAGVRATLSITITETEDSSDPLVVDGMKFEFFNCDAADYAYYNGLGVAYNNYSTCCYVTYKNTVILMTGDLESAGMTRVCAQDYVHKCDIMKMPHHGASNGNLAFFIQASPDYIAMSLDMGDMDYGTITYNQVLLANQIGAKVYACAYGQIVVGLNDSIYSLLTESPQIFGFPSYTLTVVVDATASAVGNGTAEHPFKRLEDAIAYVGDNFATTNNVTILVKGAYTVSNGLNIRNMKPKVTIEGEQSGGTNLLKINGKNVIQNVNIVFSKIDFEFSGEGIQFSINNSTVRYANCKIYGSQKTGSQDNQRCINCGQSNVRIENTSITDKGVVVSCVSGYLTAINLSGTGNLSLAGGSLATVRFFGATIAYDKLVGYWGDSFECYYNDSEEFKTSGMFLVRRSIQGSLGTITLDFSDSRFQGGQIHIYTGNGDLYIIDRWNSSFSSVFHAITGTLLPGQSCTITPNADLTITISHNDAVRVFFVR